MSVGGGDVNLPGSPGRPDDAGDYEAAVRTQEQREAEGDPAESAAAGVESGERPQQGRDEPVDPDDQPGEFGGPETVAPRESPTDKSNT